MDLRPHLPECARSRLVSVATQGRAWLVPGWETAWEYQVLSTVHCPTILGDQAMLLLVVEEVARSSDLVSAGQRHSSGFGLPSGIPAGGLLFVLGVFWLPCRR